ncbi:MAG: hypothetical protein HRU82_02040 [Nitrospira sp.]|nr:MAG: hypothetical protein HRU82_02040 [Nitrospira sp.]
MEDRTDHRRHTIEERLDGLEEMGKALKEDIEARSEETSVTDTDSIC